MKKQVGFKYIFKCNSYLNSYLKLHLNTDQVHFQVRFQVQIWICTWKRTWNRIMHLKVYLKLYLNYFQVQFQVWIQVWFALEYVLELLECSHASIFKCDPPSTYTVHGFVSWGSIANIKRHDVTSGCVISSGCSFRMQLLDVLSLQDAASGCNFWLCHDWAYSLYMFQLFRLTAIALVLTLVRTRSTILVAQWLQKHHALQVPPQSSLQCGVLPQEVMIFQLWFNIYIYI